MHSPHDYGLTAKQLEEKYEKRDYHPEYWRQDSPNPACDQLYWEWVVTQLAIEEDRLSLDNPYNSQI